MKPNNRTESQFTVRVPDLSSVEAQVLEFRQQARPEASEPRLKQGFGYVKASNGKHYAIGTEGVGRTVSIEDEGVATLDYYFSYPLSDEDRADGRKGKKVDIFPAVKMTLTAEEVFDLPVKEEVRLDQFIRRFGSRLESNYYAMNKFLCDPDSHQVPA